MDPICYCLDTENVLMRERMTSILWLTVLVLIVALVGVGLWQTSGPNPMLLTYQQEPVGIMGTDCQLRVVVPADRDDAAAAALTGAEEALRDADRAMSTYISSSGLSRLNASTPGEPVFLGADILAVLNLSRQFTDLTDGAFDPTYSPVFLRWKHSARQGRLPTPEELAAADEASGWRRFEIQHDAVLRLHEDARIDLGGIAKGWAVDRAIDAMRRAGVTGALVNVGGDMRCFGDNVHGQPWRVGIENPFIPDKGRFVGALVIRDAAVCTSGNYRRFSEIDGERYSHIVDPRTGRPVDAAPSVTVIAPSAAAADAWATALSVLGPDGLELIPENTGIEAMLIIGDEDDYRFIRTDGFDAFLLQPLASQPASQVDGR